MFHLLRNINDKNIFKNNKIKKLCAKFESARNLQKNTTAAIAVQQLRRFRFGDSACCPACFGAKTRDVARANARLYAWAGRVFFLKSGAWLVTLFKRLHRDDLDVYCHPWVRRSPRAGTQGIRNRRAGGALQQRKIR